MKENVTQETIVIEKPQQTKQSNKQKRKWNIQGIIGVVALVIIAIIAFNIIRNITDQAKGPVVGQRFKNSLSEKIGKEHLQSLADKMKFDGVEKVEVNLISATLRINLDIKDDASKDEVENILQQVDKILLEALPQDTYFTNKGDIKMYDYEIHVFNTITKIDDKQHVYMMKGKTGAGETYTEVLSEPKDKTVFEEVTKQP